VDKDIFKEILEHLGEGVYITDEKGLCLFFNESAVSILGYKKEELIGKHNHLVFHYKKPDGSEYPEEECPIYQTIKDGKTRKDIKEYFITKEGKFIPVRLRFKINRQLLIKKKFML